MTPAQRDQLQAFAHRTTHLFAGDKRWGVTSELQRAGLVRLRWGPGQMAQIEVTDAGRDALREASNG